MDISNISADENGIAAKATIINISSEMVPQVTVPTVSNLHLDIERWTAPLVNSGIVVKSINPGPDSKFMADKKLGAPKKKKGAKVLSGFDKKQNDKKADVPYQTVELTAGYKPIFGATKHVKLRVGSSTYALLLSADDTVKGAWSIVEGFDAVNKKPEMKPFNEQVYTAILHESFGS